MRSLLDRFLGYYDPLRRGFTESGVANAMGLTRGRFWSRIRGGYNLRRAVDFAPGVSDPVIGATGFDATSIANFAWRDHAADTRYCYRLSAVGPGGVEEFSQDNIVTVAFEADGVLIGPRPNVPTNLRVTPQFGGQFLLRWTYTEVGEEVAPAEFRVFHDNGSGIVDYGTAVATVAFRNRRFHYAHSTSAYAQGARRLWSVRGVSASGVDDGNTIAVLGVADAEGPPVHPAPVAASGTEM